jgi:AraC family transcriptional regulator
VPSPSWNSPRPVTLERSTAVAVRSLDELPEGLSGVRISRRPYAIFHHSDHISKIGATCAAIFGEWQPKSGQKIEKEPLFLIEHYGSAFEPDSGRGGMEIWVPLKN